MWCGVLGWCRARAVVCGTRVRFMRGASELSCVATRVLSSRVAAVPSPLVYFERRIANGHGFARVYRDLISNIYNYGPSSRRKIDNNTSSDRISTTLAPHRPFSDGYRTRRKPYSSCRTPVHPSGTQSRMSDPRCLGPSLCYPCEAPTTAPRTRRRRRERMAQRVWPWAVH